MSQASGALKKSAEPPTQQLMSRRTVALSLAALALNVGFAPAAVADPNEGHAPSAFTNDARPLMHGGVIVVGAGEARVGHGGAWHAIEPGAVLPLHAELRTDKDPLRVQLAGGAVIELSADGSAALAGEVELLLGEYDTPTLSRVALRKGEVSVIAGAPQRASRATRGGVLVQGPDGVMAVVCRGSMARVRVLPREGDLPAGLAVALDT